MPLHFLDLHVRCGLMDLYVLSSPGSARPMPPCLPLTYLHHCDYCYLGGGHLLTLWHYKMASGSSCIFTVPGPERVISFPFQGMLVPCVGECGCISQALDARCDK